jgi:bifunctional non-homologous end joining protein LigD
VTWAEVQACAEGGPELRFTWREVLARVEELGDLFAPVLTLQQTLPGG